MRNKIFKLDCRSKSKIERDFATIFRNGKGLSKLIPLSDYSSHYQGSDIIFFLIKLGQSLYKLTIIIIILSLTPCLIMKLRR